MPTIHTHTTCYHCGDKCPSNSIHTQGKTFCCNGCMMVYNILNQNQLCQYYELNQNPGIKQNTEMRKGKFDFLSQPEILQTLISFTDGKQTHITLYLPQIHCSSCLWLLENLDTIAEGVIQAKVNFINKEIYIVYQNQYTSLQKIVETLTKIGYEPHLSLQNMSQYKPNTINRARWYKIGVAGFCFSNIMMLSFPEYLLATGSIDAILSNYFKTIIIILALPALFYSGSEFFISAYKALRQKYLNIDAPVALALAITFTRSLYEIFTHTGNGYLDSMSGIIFFMLIGRWLQDRTYNVINFERDFTSFFPIAVNIIKNQNSTPTPIQALLPQDIIEIHNQEIIPADSILSKGEALIDYSFVTGESQPIKINPGEMIYAGAKQMGGLIELLVVKPVSQSYLTSLWNKDISTTTNRTQKQTIIDLVGKYFTYMVLLIGLLAGVYWQVAQKGNLSWNAITTVLIVACPCALLLSENFTNSNFIRILAYNKFYIKNKTVLENLQRIKTIVFDKTGTLTQSNKNLVSYTGQTLSHTEQVEIASILHQTMHSLALPIIQFLEINNPVKVKDFKETTGKGIEAWINETYYKIGSASFLGIEKEKHEQSYIFIKKNTQIIGKFAIGAKYRPHVMDMIMELKSKFTLALLSGDNDAEAEHLGKIFGENSQLLFHQKPDDKQNFIKNLIQKNNEIMMIGDGLNDAYALKTSTVGVALADNKNVFTPSSDAIIEASSLKNLHHILAFIKHGKTLIFITFGVSAIYNLVGLYYAVQGILSPLIAAVLMPLSSITIIGITYFMTNYFAKKNYLYTQSPTPTNY